MYIVNFLINRVKPEGIYGSTDFAKSRILQEGGKQFRLYFDQFCNLLPLKHALQYMFNQRMRTNVEKKTLKKAQRPKKALDPSKSHHFETFMCSSSFF